MCRTVDYANARRAAAVGFHVRNPQTDPSGIALRDPRRLISQCLSPTACPAPAPLSAPQGVRAGGDPFRDLHHGRWLSVTAGAPIAPGGPPRFALHVVDSPEKDEAALKESTDHVAAIFLVPQGRENAWLFSAEEGLQSLRASARAQRLVVVRLRTSQPLQHLSPSLPRQSSC